MLVVRAQLRPAQAFRQANSCLHPVARFAMTRLVLPAFLEQGVKTSVFGCPGDGWARGTQQRGRVPRRALRFAASKDEAACPANSSYG